MVNQSVQLYQVKRIPPLLVPDGAGSFFLRFFEDIEAGRGPWWAHEWRRLRLDMRRGGQAVLAGGPEDRFQSPACMVFMTC